MFRDRPARRDNTLGSLTPTIHTQFHGDFTGAWWFKLPATRMFVQPLVPNDKKNQSSALPTLCEGNPLVNIIMHGLSHDCSDGHYHRGQCLRWHWRESPAVLVLWYYVCITHPIDGIFGCVFVNEKFCILIKISLMNVPKSPMDNGPALV